MKGIILEKKDGLAAVLREDGVVLKIQTELPVGETMKLPAYDSVSDRENEERTATPQAITVIPNDVKKCASDKTISRKSARRKGWQQLAAAAVLVIAVMCGSYGYLTVPACAAVTLDTGEVSVELSVNRLGNVIGVKPLNEDSDELARNLSGELRGQNADEAINEVLQSFQASGYLTDNKELTTEVSSGNTAKKELYSQILEQSLQKIYGSIEETAGSNNPTSPDSARQAVPENAPEPAPSDNTGSNGSNRGSGSANNGTAPQSGNPDPQSSGEDSDSPAPASADRNEDTSPEPTDNPPTDRNSRSPDAGTQPYSQLDNLSGNKNSDFSII